MSKSNCALDSDGDIEVFHINEENSLFLTKRDLLMMLKDVGVKNIEVLINEKRTEIAAMALQGFIASDLNGVMSQKDIAKLSAEHADELIKELGNNEQ